MCFQKPRNQGVDIVMGVIGGERCTRCCGYAKMFHQRLRAMMAGAHSNAGPVEYCRNVMGMRALNRESDDRRFVGGASIDAHEIEFRKFPQAHGL